MALMLSSETYQRLQKRLGEEEARDLVEALGDALDTFNKKTDENLQRTENKADFLITQKKFELKDELTKELATKADIVRLEGEMKAVRQEMQTIKLELDRKFTIMFIILLFTTIFLNQNALRFIAEVFGLIRP